MQTAEEGKASEQLEWSLQVEKAGVADGSTRRYTGMFVNLEMIRSNRVHWWVWLEMGLVLPAVSVTGMKLADDQITDCHREKKRERRLSYSSVAWQPNRNLGLVYFFSQHSFSLCLKKTL